MTVNSIPLTQGRFAIVDDDDFEDLTKHKWYYMPIGYAGRHSKLSDPEGSGKFIYMHRVIMNALPKQEVDHVNHDKLDNRRINLRLASSRQNKCNTNLRINNKSGLKGVSWSKRRKLWTAQVKVSVGRTQNLGYYDNKYDAYAAYCSVARELYGEFARV